MTRSRNRSALQERYSVLLDIGRTLAATLRPAELYRAVWQQASRVIQAEGFFISRYDPANDLASTVFYAARGEEQVLQLTYPGRGCEAIYGRRPTLQSPEDVEHWELGMPAPPAGLHRTGMVAPMLRGDEVLGVIGAQSYARDTYEQSDLEIFAAIADLASVALENALYVEQLERRRREAERIEEIGRAVTGSLDLSKVLARVTRAALDLLEADGAIVWLMRDDNQVEVAMTAGDTLFPHGLVCRVDASILSAVRRAPRSSFSNLADVSFAPEEYRHVATAGSSTAVLLTADDSFIGALSVRHRVPRAYTEEDVRLLSRIADQAAIAVANARLHERIIALSLTDPLTGLPNRRHLQMFLEKEFAAARRGRRLAIVLYDLDNFKEYNDSAGHQAGDEALRAFARILAENTRAMNLSARFGGDEFIAVLTDVSRRGTVTHVERIVRALEQHPLLGPAGIRVTAGIAVYGPHLGSAEALVKAADRNLYRRKQIQRQAAELPQTASPS